MAASAGVLALAFLLVLAPSALAALPVGGLAPVPKGSGATVQWTPVGVESSYRLAVSTDARGRSDRATVYLNVPRSTGETQSYTPTVPPGATYYVGVSSDNGTTWSSQEVAVVGTPSAQPPAVPPTEPAASQGGSNEAEEEAEGEGEGEAPEAEASPRSANAERSVLSAASTSKAMIGTEDGSGWGTAAARALVQGHITWNRVELGFGPSVATSLSEGFKVLAIVKNTNDSTPLSQVNPSEWGAGVVAELKATPGISIAEAANESYYKGGVANPVQYGRMYLAAVEDMKAAGIRTPLLFNMTGDYPSRGTWTAPTSWSQDSSGGGWLRDAVKGVPGLASAIRANGLSIHPYGAVGQDTHDDWGVSAAAALESVAQSVLGSIPPFYITEFGYDLKRCGEDIGACTKRQQATKMRAAYNVFLADPHIAGIWWYQSHDDSTGHFGFMNNDNTPRKAFKTLSGIAAAAGQ